MKFFVSYVIYQDDTSWAIGQATVERPGPIESADEISAIREALQENFAADQLTIITIIPLPIGRLPGGSG